MYKLRTSTRILPCDRHRLGQIVIALAALSDEILMAGTVIKYTLNMLQLLFADFKAAVDFVCKAVTYDELFSLKEFMLHFST